MPASFSLTLHFPLPAALSPHLVIRALHAHEPLIRPNPYLQTFRRLPAVDADDLEATSDDPFFSSSSPSSSPPAPSNNTTGGQDRIITSYEIHDRIPVVASLGLYKDTIFPALFQNTPTGVKVKVDAAMGVRVRSVYEVSPTTTTITTEGKEGGGGGGGGGQDWELVEKSHVECSPLLKPFVMKQFEAGHRDLCQKVLDNLVADSASAGAGATGSSGTRAVTSVDKDLPPLPGHEEATRW